MKCFEILCTGSMVSSLSAYPYRLKIYILFRPQPLCPKVRSSAFSESGAKTFYHLLNPFSFVRLAMCACSSRVNTASAAL